MEERICINIAEKKRFALVSPKLFYLFTLTTQLRDEHKIDGFFNQHGKRKERWWRRKRGRRRGRKRRKRRKRMKMRHRRRNDDDNDEEEKEIWREDQ